MTKKIIQTLYTLIIVCIGSATILEKFYGTKFTSEHIYGAWWFIALWALLIVVSCAYMIQQHLYKRVAVMLLHMSFVVILVGALTTHLTAKRGSVELIKDIPITSFADNEGCIQTFPFSLTLKEFRIVNYPGTDAPLDYQCALNISPNYSSGNTSEVVVSMNHIGNIDGYRLFLSSYDTDGQGVLLGVSRDIYGIAITYMGYIMLLAGIITTLLSRKAQMRTLYKKAMKPIAVSILMPFTLMLVSVNASANDELPVVDKDIAHRMGTINVLYNNRICPLNTVATDFVMKLSGNASWQGYSADEIFVSWMIFYSPWEQQKLIRVKNYDIQQLLGINGQWASYSDFLNDYHEYKLKDVLEKSNTSDKSINRKALMDADEKFHVIEMFYHGEFIKMFPYCSGDTVNWYMPGGQSLPREIPVKEQFFIKQAMDYLTESIVTGQRDRTFEIIAKIKLFQHDMIGSVIPSENKTNAEIFYNTVRNKKWPVFLSLTLSLLLCVVMLTAVQMKRIRVITLLFVILLTSYVTLMLGLRWWISGHLPVSNGHETMLFMAWVVLLLTIVLHKKYPIMVGFGPLVCSFCLLVAMLAGSNSQITPLMPVLQSPLLSVHVMTVMCAYALFALQVLLGIHAFLLIKKKKDAELEKTTSLSQFLLYPAVFLLTIGIFLGAVWANVSWGNYWSWDPKESWALITLMVYAIPLHKTSIKVFSKPFNYHLYMIIAFLAVIITYFGVNYLLGGMHSYA